MKTEMVLGADTSQFEGAMDRAASKARQVNDAMAIGRSDMAWTSSAALPSMTDNVAQMGPNGELLKNINSAYDSMDKELRQIIDSFRRLRDVLKTSEVMPAPAPAGGAVDPNPDNPPGSGDRQAAKKDKEKKRLNVAGGVIGASQGLSDAARSVAGGDPWSAGLGGLNRIGQGAMKRGTAADGSMGILGMLGTAGVVAALLGTGANALANQYENALPGIDSLLTAFGGVGVNGAGAKTNAARGLTLRSVAANMSKGTGMDTDEFISYMSSLSRHGITDATQAGSLTNAAAGWSRYTGADMGQVLDYMGTVERYGGNGRDATMGAYNAARAAGLEKGQFAEFLSGIQRVMEDGISKGFIRSSKEVADSLANLSLLGGGNKVFQGEAGARMYMNMASGLAGNTALSSTSNLLAYRTMANMMGDDDANASKLLGKGNYLADGSVFNELALMEKGDVGNLDFLKELRRQVEGAYGKDRDSIVASYKEIFGLNNQGAIQVYNALTDTNLSDVERQAKLQSIQEDPTMKSDATRLQDTLTELNKAIVEIGKPVFNVKLGGLEALESGVNKIYTLLMGDSYKALVGTVADGMFDKHEHEKQRAFEEDILKRLTSPNADIRGEAIRDMDVLSGLSEMQKATVNARNLDPFNLPSEIRESSYNDVKNVKGKAGFFDGSYSIEGIVLLGTAEHANEAQKGLKETVLRAAEYNAPREFFQELANEYSRKNEHHLEELNRLMNEKLGKFIMAIENSTVEVR